jgi:ABC-type transport system involved in Fe-S cluster assembly fused permease/ATPase subunit
LYVYRVFLYSFYLQKKQEKYKLALNKAEDIEKGFVSDIFTNIDSVKYFGKEKRINSLFNQKASTTRDASLKTWEFLMA